MSSHPSMVIHLQRLETFVQHPITVLFGRGDVSFSLASEGSDIVRRTKRGRRTERVEEFRILWFDVRQLSWKRRVRQMTTDDSCDREISRSFSRVAFNRWTMDWTSHAFFSLCRHDVQETTKFCSGVVSSICISESSTVILAAIHCDRRPSVLRLSMRSSSIWRSASGTISHPWMRRDRFSGESCRCRMTWARRGCTSGSLYRLSSMNLPSLGQPSGNR